MTTKSNKLLLIFKSGVRHSVDVSDSTLTNFIEFDALNEGEVFDGQTSRGGSFSVSIKEVALWEVLK